MTIPCVFAPLICHSLEHRNLKTRQRGIYGDTGKTLQLDPSLTSRVGISIPGNIEKLFWDSSQEPDRTV